MTRKGQDKYTAKTDQDLHFIMKSAFCHKFRSAPVIRPGAHKFLQEMSTIYDMHVATLGTKPYAKEVVKILDPEMNLLQPVRFSREFFNGMPKDLVLQKMFDVEKHPPAVAIDDQETVWGDGKKHVVAVKGFLGNEQDSSYMEELASLLKDIHKEYFKHLDQMQLDQMQLGNTVEELPDVCAVIKDMHSNFY